MSIFAISDLHGRMDLYQEVCGFLKPEDRVYCLGDCGDRGPDGWTVIKAVYENPQWVYLMGNHEHMLYWAMRKYLWPEEKCPYYSNHPVEILWSNGGKSTFDGWIKEGCDQSWLSRLNNLHRYINYINKSGITVNLSHAGFSPGNNPTSWDLIWDRDHTLDWWPQEFENNIVVHGHTPTVYIMSDINMIDKFSNQPLTYPEYEPGALTYCNGHKIDIDCGSYATNHTVLLDLDTFNEHIFGIPDMSWGDTVDD